MRTLILILAMMSTTLLSAQEDNATTFEKMPVTLQNQLYAECTSIQMTLYKSGKSYTFQGKNATTVVTFIDIVPPKQLTKPSHAYVMFLKQGDEIVDGDLVKGEDGRYYLMLNYKGKRYFNMLSKGGQQFMGQFK